MSIRPCVILDWVSAVGSIIPDIFILLWQAPFGAKIFWDTSLEVLRPFYILDPILWSDQPIISCI